LRNRQVRYVRKPKTTEDFINELATLHEMESGAQQKNRLRYSSPMKRFFIMQASLMKPHNRMRATPFISRLTSLRRALIGNGKHSYGQPTSCHLHRQAR